MLLENVKLFIKENKNLTPLNNHSKQPSLKNWTKTKLSNQEMLNHAAERTGMGWVLGHLDLVIDVDLHKAEAYEAFNRLCKDVNTALKATVKTPRGGFHVYLKIPASYKDTQLVMRDNLKATYPGIDFLTIGRQCVIPGTVTAQGKYTWANDAQFTQPLASEILINILASPAAQGDPNADISVFDGVISNNSNYTDDDIKDMLSVLNPSMSNDQWVEIGMALHNYNPETGLELWEEWSKAGANYKAGETEKRWASFHLKSQKSVTIATLIYRARQQHIVKRINERKMYESRIEKASEEVIKTQIIQDIKKHGFNIDDQSILADALKKRLKDVDAPMRIDDIRKQLIPVKVMNIDKPDWVKDWLYVNSHKQLVNLKTHEILSKDMFDMRYSVNVPGAQTAMKYAVNYNLLDFVHKFVYMPDCKKRIVKHLNETAYNTFNVETLPPTANEITEEGEEACRRIKYHVLMLCNGNKEHAKILMLWIAHQVQFPGKKLNWVPLIQSIPGVGKSFIKQLLKACLGDSNAAQVTCTQIESDFNGWAVNKCVIAMEEIRLAGKNRHYIIEKIKPLITENTIDINQKNVESYQVPNVCNFIAFTNHRDALPAQDQDRRWWVIFNNIESLNLISKYNIYKENKDTYFNKLFETLNFASEIKRWLFDIKIPAWFFALKQAPHTHYKELMENTDNAMRPGYLELKSLIELGGAMYSTKIVSSTHLFTAFALEFPDLQLTPQDKNRLLKNLGYSQLFNFNTFKYLGQRCSIWSKDVMTKEQAKELIDETMGGCKQDKVVDIQTKLDLEAK